MKTIGLLFLLSCSTIKAGVSGNNQAYLEKIYCAFDSINNEIVKNNKATADTIMNTISPEIVSLMYMIFNDDIKDIQSKEGIKTDSFPSYQYDIKNDFEKFELPELRHRYLPASKYITFFSKPADNFLIAEVFERDNSSANSSNYKVVSMFGESIYFLFYFDSSNKIKYVRKMAMSHN